MYCVFWHNSVMIYDGKKITSLRQEKGWSMARLAQQAKISQPSLWALEHQKTKKPKADTMMRIAAALGVPLQQIMPTQGVRLDDAEEQLLAAFHGLRLENKGALIAAAKALLDSQK